MKRIVLAVAVLGSLTACNLQNTATNYPTVGSSEAASVTSAPQKPSGPSMTVAQRNALESAKGYLNMGSGFSRSGLIDQLVNGESFSRADATFAVDHTGADWNAQAALSAKGYMKMGGFSRSSLIEQLVNGEGFTQAQAEVGAKAVGY